MAKTISQVKVAANRYYTIAAQNGRVLESAVAENGAAVVLAEAVAHRPEQEWKFVREGDGVYRIVNRATKLALDLMMGGLVDGTWLHAWEAGTGSSQLWQLLPTNDGRAQLAPLMAPRKCMDTVGMSTEVGARLQLWENVNGENQVWNIAEAKAKRASSAKAAPKAEAAAEKPAKKACKAPAKKKA